MLPFEFDEKFYFYLALSVPVLFAPLETLLLKRFGTTLGKKIFGLRLPPLSWKESLAWAFCLKPKKGLIAKPIPGWRYLMALAMACGAALTFFKTHEITEAAVQYEQRVAGKDWVDYISDDGRFKVSFPKKPAAQTTQVEDHSLHELKVEKEAAFSVSFIELPRKWRLFSAPTLLKGAMNVILERTQGVELIEKKLVKHKNYPAMDYRLKEGENEIEGRLILVENTLYRLMVTYYPDTPKELQHEVFVSSFELKD